MVRMEARHQDWTRPMSASATYIGDGAVPMPGASQKFAGPTTDSRPGDRTSCGPTFCSRF
jgi:hypothetical protein